MRRALVASLTMIATMVPAGSSLAGSMTYLSIGDSVAFGETDFTQNPSNGDRGFVSDYANYLATQNGGVRPNVVNLAIDGETSGSFFSGMNRVLSVPGETNQSDEAWNTRYSSPDTTSQDVRMLEAFSNQKALGNSIGVVTISLGANDLFQLAASSAFQSATPAAQQAMLGQTLNTIATNYAELLSQIHTALPNAKVYLLGEYNPFPGQPTNPLNAIAGPAIAGLNMTIEALAAKLGGTYVDTYTPFVGHEAEYTYINSTTMPGNVHPNALGYSIIATQVEIAPEPSTLAIAALGIAGLAYRARQLRRRAASMIDG